MMSRIQRKEVKKLTPYVPGKPIEDVQKDLGVKEVIRLASNENPLGPSPRAIEAMEKALKDSWLYPEPTGRSLRNKLANTLGLNADNFILGNGADHILTLISNAYINEGDEAIYCTPTFSSYKESVLLMGGVPIEVECDEDYICNLDSILEKINNKTKLIYICNPNNPTGTILDHIRLKDFIEKLPKDIVVVLDEAYIEYVNQSGYKTGLDFIKSGHPVIAVRTFSKYYGLAGLRIGYGIGDQKLLDPLIKVRQTFPLNRIGLIGAEVALSDKNHTHKVLSNVVKGKKNLTVSLEKIGYTVIESHANFLFVDLKSNANEIFNKLMRKGILIRPCGPWKLENFARITIGTREHNDLLIKTLEEI